jgi:dipeptidase E
MKLLLYSDYKMSPDQLDVLIEMVGKDPQDITIAAITNSVDVYDDTEWVKESVGSLETKGSQAEVVDLRQYRGNPAGLREKLASKDVIWLCGGHTYYLRWLLRDTGADAIITDLVRSGKVYSGWSAGACVAGVNIHYFEFSDDPKDAPEMIYDGLGLLDGIVLPHMNSDDFVEGMTEANNKFIQEGYTTYPLNDGQAVVVNDGEPKVI